MTEHEPERQTIRDAMTRLLVGEPIRSDGKLTIKSLAEEAGVGRWLLTHRHTDLQAEFRDRVAAHGADPEPVRLLKEQLASAAQENKDLRVRLREAQATISMLERQIVVETLEGRSTSIDPIGHPTRLRPVPDLSRPPATNMDE